MSSSNPRHALKAPDRAGDIKRTAEAIRAQFMRRHARADASYCWKALAAALLSSMGAVAFRVFTARLMFADTDGKNSYPSQDTLAKLLGADIRTIRRADAEIIEHAYAVQERRRRATANFTLIEGDALNRIISEIIGAQDRSDMSSLEPQDRTEVSPLNQQDRTELTGQENQDRTVFAVKTGQICPPTYYSRPTRFAAGPNPTNNVESLAAVVAKVSETLAAATPEVSVPDLEASSRPSRARQGALGLTDASARKPSPVSDADFAAAWHALKAGMSSLGKECNRSPTRDRMLREMIAEHGVDRILRMGERLLEAQGLRADGDAATKLSLSNLLSNRDDIQTKLLDGDYRDKWQVPAGQAHGGTVDAAEARKKLWANVDVY